ncbi:MAG: hypothetical protein C5B54_04615, partial [Acidobacteria bacterium]
KLRRIHRAAAVLTWIGIYVAGKAIWLAGRATLSEADPFIIVAEITLPSLLIWQAHKLTSALFEFEKAVEDITMDGMTRPLVTVEEASDVLQKQLRLSRRNNRPLSVILLECEQESFEITLNRAMEDAQRAIITRHSLISLSKALDRLLRSSDLILENPGKRHLVLVCPETTQQSSRTLSDRLRQTAQELGLVVSCASASLPEDALTLDELIKKAESNLHRTIIPHFKNVAVKKSEVAADEGDTNGSIAHAETNVS